MHNWIIGDMTKECKNCKRKIYMRYTPNVEIVENSKCPSKAPIRKDISRKKMAVGD